MSEVLERPAKRAVILNPQRLGLAEQMRQDWVVNVEDGGTKEDLLDPQYWAHCASQFQQFDHVECRWENGERIVFLIVVATGRNWTQMHVASVIELTKPSEALAASSKHVVEWKGPQRKHVVIRIADSQSIQENFSTKAEATVWMQNHERLTG